MSYEDQRWLLAELRERFEIVLLPTDRTTKPSAYRDDVSEYFYDLETQRSITVQRESMMRRWIESQNWQFSKHQVGLYTAEWLYLAPMIFDQLEIGYHATRRSSVSSIMVAGLLPSAPSRCTTDRADCEGNVYVCKNLGTLADAGVQGTHSAHWWRDHLAKNNRFDDTDWLILEVDFRSLREAKLYKDIWSESGIIASGFECIPPERIRVIYPT